MCLFYYNKVYPKDTYPSPGIDWMIDEDGRIRTPLLYGQQFRL